VVADDVHVGAVVVDANIPITGDIEALNVYKIAKVGPGGAYPGGGDFRASFNIREEGNA